MGKLFAALLLAFLITLAFCDSSSSSEETKYPKDHHSTSTTKAVILNETHQAVSTKDTENVTKTGPIKNKKSRIHREAEKKDEEVNKPTLEIIKTKTDTNTSIQTEKLEIKTPTMANSSENLNRTHRDESKTDMHHRNKEIQPIEIFKTKSTKENARIENETLPLSPAIIANQSHSINTTANSRARRQLMSGLVERVETHEETIKEVYIKEDDELKTNDKKGIKKDKEADHSDDGDHKAESESSSTSRIPMTSHVPVTATEVYFVSKSVPVTEIITENFTRNVAVTEVVTLTSIVPATEIIDVETGEKITTSSSTWMTSTSTMPISSSTTNEASTATTELFVASSRNQRSVTSTPEEEATTTTTATTTTSNDNSTIGVSTTVEAATTTIVPLMSEQSDENAQTVTKDTRKQCKKDEICFNHNECGKGGKCIGDFYGTCNCDGCKDKTDCFDDAACGGLQGACDKKTGFCNCMHGFEALGFKNMTAANAFFCNKKKCSGSGRSDCFGMSCSFGRCECN